MIWMTVLTVQVATFIVLAARYLCTGQWRLGVAQGLLAAVQAVLYSGGLR